MGRRTTTEEHRPSVYINTKILGEPVEWLIEWKRWGMVASNTDAIVQVLRALNEKIVEQDLKNELLKRLKRG